MSVLIKDMEMPTSCNACELAALVDISDGIAYGCRALKEMIYNDRERLPNCPLVEVPEDVQPVKHGKNIATEYDEVDQFVCSECGIELQNWVRVERDEDDGDETHHEYRFNFCPNCGADVRGDA